MIELTKLKHFLACGFAASAVLFACASDAQADVVDGATLGGGAATADLGFSTFTTTAQTGLLTVNASGNFGANAARFGIFGGTNNAALDDGDGVRGGADAETMSIVLNTIAANNIGALESISWDFSRADGPAADSGVFISGFLADPLAVVSGAVGSSSVDYAAGVVRLDLSGADFGNPDGTVTFGNLFASAGQTLSVEIADSPQGGPQIAFTGITAVAVPEPAAATCLALLGLCGFVRRRR